MHGSSGHAAVIPTKFRIFALSLAATLVAFLALASPSLAADYIYWSQNVSSPTSSSTVARANIDGTGANTSFAAAGSTVGGIAYDATHIYWAGPNGVSRANIDGTGVTLIHSSPVAPGIAIDDKYFYAFAPGSGPSSGNIIRGNLDGSGVNATFLPITGDAFYLAINSSHIYWADGVNSKIGRANIDGTGANESFISTSTGLQGIALNDSNVFWALSTNNAIGRANLDGTGVNNSFMSVTNPRALAVGGNYIYWSNGAAPRDIGRANIDGTSPNASFISTGATATVFGIAAAPAGPARYDLSVTRAGSGSGAVTSSPAGIDCGATCTATFDGGAAVTLTATAAAGSNFTGWSGACTGAAATCTVTMSQAQSVTATFTVFNTFTVRTPLLVGTGIRTLVAVPGPGVVRQAGTFRYRGKIRQACGSGALAAPAAGVVRMRCRLSDVARAARKKGAVRVLLATTYTPTGGTANVVLRTVVLRSLKPRYTG